MKKNRIRISESGFLTHFALKDFFYNKKKWIFLAAGILVIIILAVIIIKTAIKTDGEEVKKGIDYLEELEGKDIDSVEGEVKKVKKEARDQAMEEGSLSVWAQFGDYAIYGDSRAVGFYFHEFLDKQRVFADTGLKISDFSNYKDQIMLLNPSYLFLCTGLNDVRYWRTTEEYVQAYEAQVEAIRKDLPDTQIYINSIFPVLESAAEKQKELAEVPEYNKALKALCKEKKYSYVDNTKVYKEHKDLYEEDGIHFQKEFYQFWAINMVDEEDG